eukprot:COSAG03_NODE_602_length_6755_cov_12.895282_9_plen_87_part_00
MTEHLNHTPNGPQRRRGAFEYKTTLGIAGRRGAHLAQEDTGQQHRGITYARAHTTLTGAEREGGGERRRERGSRATERVRAKSDTA